MTVQELLTRISSAELAEWIAYARLEPWGEARSDLRMGILASVQANCHRGKGKAPYRPDDFIPKWGKSGKREMTPDETIRFAEEWVKATGGKVIHG